MTQKEQDFASNWEKTIKFGRFKYALVQGIFFGVVTYIVSSIILFFFFSDKTVFQFDQLLTRFITFLIVGFLFFYFYNWSKGNKKYNSLVNK